MTFGEFREFRRWSRGYVLTKTDNDSATGFCGCTWDVYFPRDIPSEVNKNKTDSKETILETPLPRVMEVGISALGSR
ncbi:hypothetical protein IMZ48_44955 [Candidatus Bathyarchaeota archaeon]|nr:hypothetical protein [Candidatus Bathyarchaeota archaeon]